MRWTVAIVMLLPGCTSLMGPPPSFQTDEQRTIVREQTASAYEDLKVCSDTYVRVHIASSLTASEMADAAWAACSSEVQAAVEQRRSEVMSNYIAENGHRPSPELARALDGVASNTTGIKEKMRGRVLALIAEETKAP